MRIGIFGGTFNPPHLGHRHIVEDFCAQMAAFGRPLDKVLIIPTFVPPHKAAPDLAPGEDRMEMCRLTFDRDPVFTVSDFEMVRGGQSYTWETLEAVHAKYDSPAAPAELYFLMGDDMLLYLPHWMRPEKILADTVIVSTIRSSACTVDELQAFARNHYPEQFRQDRFLFFESDPFPVSSTEIRELVKQQDIHRLKELLDEDVLQYILDRRLYQ